MIIEGRKTVRLFDSSEVLKMCPNKRGSFGRTVQSSIDLEKNEEKIDIVNYYATLDVGDV